MREFNSEHRATCANVVNVPDRSHISSEAIQRAQLILEHPFSICFINIYEELLPCGKRFRLLQASLVAHYEFYLVVC